MNPAFKETVLQSILPLPTDYQIKVPESERERLLSCIPSIPERIYSFLPSRKFKWKPLITGKRILKWSELDKRHRIELMKYFRPAGNIVVVEPGETIEKYHIWIKLPIKLIKKINRIGKGKQLRPGERIKLSFKRVNVESFTYKRAAYHYERLRRYLIKNSIVGEIKHRVRRNENLWKIAKKIYGVPFWIVMKFNPDIDPENLKEGNIVKIPVIKRKRF
jgi:hypothetical protein